MNFFLTTTSFAKRVIITEAYVGLMKMKMIKKKIAKKFIEESERFTEKAENSRKIQAMMNYLLFHAFIIHLEIEECSKQKKNH